MPNGARCPRCGAAGRKFGDDLCVVCEEHISGAAALVRCSKCGDSKPPSEFHRNRRMKTGLHYSCKKCNSLAKAEAYRRPEVREKKLAAKARRLDELAPPGTKRAMRRALQQIVAQVYDRDCEPTAETADICGRIARAALEGEDA